MGLVTKPKSSLVPTIIVNACIYNPDERGINSVNNNSFHFLSFSGGFGLLFLFPEIIACDYYIPRGVDAQSHKLDFS